MSSYPTPHIKATPADFAPTVLMPGDPLRSRFIAKEFQTNARLVNDVRGVQGYTGFYGDTRVSVMASGMGMPSIGIYSYELYHAFGVENILRVGSAGAYADKVNVRDIIFGMGACTNSSFAHQFHLPGTYSAICDYDLLRTSVGVADALGVRYHIGNLLSSDTFYNDDENLPDGLNSTFAWSKMGVLAVEMEAAALYMTAARAGKRALAICTVSDHVVRGESLDADQRQTSFTEMIELALCTAAAMEKQHG